MKRTRKCGECGGSDIRMTTVLARGGGAPDLLPGTHPLWKSPSLEIYICCLCGYFQYFVPEDALSKVRESENFTPFR